ncbi:hypothetical protein ZYGR_0AV02440 [Zygosaccharomyces rouxii]|uniref:RRM domain-containing protein n=1 Tax=Zygosaccharomyces rouxii TaxID=4956 RepID=A0A1Q3AJ29_ZYGRO|nr:hypothetical protein ZYGR_0AV02440 [Zygosaccharomyces rouxii]
MAPNNKSHRRNNSGKKLIDRITPVGRPKPERPPTQEGFKTVNGRLVSANDVGVLLREASSKLEAKKRRKSPKGKPHKNGPAPPESKAKPSKSNPLVIHTNSDASDKLLVFYNLALGVNQDSLKTVLQKLSHARIAKVRVRDLPSGSATANVWLVRPTIEELERVRKLFDGALVDGRTIRVTTVSDTHTMSY